MTIPLTLLRVADLRVEVHSLLIRALVEAELGERSDALHCDIVQALVEAASLPNATASEREKLSKAIELADKGEALRALTAADEALSLRIPVIP